MGAIQKQILWTLIIFATLAMIITASVNYWRINSLLTEVIPIHLLTIRNSLADNVDNIFYSMVEQHYLVGSRTQLRRSIKVVNAQLQKPDLIHLKLIEKIVNDATASSKHFAGITILGNDKKVIFNSLHDKLPDWVAQSDTSTTNLTLKIHNISNSEKVIALKSSLELEGQTIGTLITFTNLNQIKKSIQEATKSHYSLGVSLNYFNESGVIDLVPNPNSINLFGKSKALPVHIKTKLFNRNDDIYEITSIDDTKYIYTAKPLFFENTTLVLSISHRVAYSLLTETTIFIVLTMGGLIILFGIASLYTSKILTKPLESLVQTTKNITDGDYTKRASEDLKGEFGVLSKHFNAMLEKIISALNHANLQQDATLNAVSDALIVLDEKGVILQVNKSTPTIFGFNSVKELIGENVKALIPEHKILEHDDYLEKYKPVKTANMIGEGVNVIAKKKDGSTFHARLNISPFKENGIRQFVGILSDISELVAYQEQLKKIALYDTLTGLARKNLLENRIELAISKAIRNSSKFALLFIDLNKFKPVNDTYGHKVGDLTLIAISERIKGETRDSDTCARIGGDEFVVLLENIELFSDIEYFKNKLKKAISKPIYLDVTITIGASIGIGLYPDNGESTTELLNFADKQMYKDKKGA